MISITVNGESHSLDVDPDMPLLWAVRDIIGITGSKFGCGKALCGACTMHKDGQAIRSCVTPIGTLQGANITTIEGLHTNVAEAVQAAWQKLDVVQCGYCQSGQIMSAVALLSGNAKPSDADIDNAMNGNICRCNTYTRIRAAIKLAAESLA